MTAAAAYEVEDFDDEDAPASFGAPLVGAEKAPLFSEDVEKTLNDMKSGLDKCKKKLESARQREEKLKAQLQEAHAHGRLIDEGLELKALE